TASWTGSSVFLMAAAALFLANQKVAGGLSAMFALLLGGLATALRKSVAIQTLDEDASPELRNAKTAYEAARKAARDHDQSWQPQALQFGLTWPTNEKELTESEARITQQERRRERHTKLRQDLEILRESKRERRRAFSNAKQ